jgi:hypothetical protein
VTESQLVKYERDDGRGALFAVLITLNERSVLQRSAAVSFRVQIAHLLDFECARFLTDAHNEKVIALSILTSLRSLTPDHNRPKKLNVAKDL